jgi:hypothetical protein
LIIGGTSANVAELITWHVGGGGDRRQIVCLNSRADQLGWGLCERKGRESSMGALRAGRAQVYGPYPMPKNSFDLHFWFGQHRSIRLVFFLTNQSACVGTVKRVSGYSFPKEIELTTLSEELADQRQTSFLH